MRTLFLTLMMSFLSHSAFGAEGGVEEEMEQHIQQHNQRRELHRKEQVEIQFLQMDETLRQTEEDRGVYLSGRLATEDDDNVIQELSPFLEAVCEGDIGRVNGFLDSGMEDINQQDLDGATPLIIAATARQDAMCRHLILRGASIEIRTHDGWNIGTILCRLRHES